jgi:hypothetical protein
MHNTELWNLDGILPSYSEVPDLRQNVINAYTGIAKFMSDNGLFKTKRKVLGPKGELLVRRVFVNDLTSEGVRFARLAEFSWFASKASNSYPANSQLLEKHLRSVRKNGTPIVGTRPPRVVPQPKVAHDPWDLEGRLARTRHEVMKALAMRHFAAALEFMRDNGLLTVKRVVDAKGKVLVGKVTSRHLTPLGARFAEAAGAKWFGSKRAFMHPQNTSMLSKILLSVRARGVV